MNEIYISESCCIIGIIFFTIMNLCIIKNDDWETLPKIICEILIIFLLSFCIYGIFSGIQKARNINSIKYYNDRIIKTENKLNELKEMKNNLFYEGEN